MSVLKYSSAVLLTFPSVAVASLELARWGAFPVMLGKKPELPKELSFYLAFFCFLLTILLLLKPISPGVAPCIKCPRIVGMASLQKFEA